jgi:hypothetical protein
VEADNRAYARLMAEAQEPVMLALERQREMAPVESQAETEAPERPAVLAVVRDGVALEQGDVGVVQPRSD